MKRKQQPGPVDTTPYQAEEYLLFPSQPAMVLQQYALTKTSMALAIPVFSGITLFHIEVALALAFAAGIIAFLLLYKKYGVKGAAAPGICALSGVAIGYCILSPLTQYATNIKEVYRGNR